MREKVLIGKVTVPEEYKKWFKHCNKDGEVYAMKSGRILLSPEEKKRREDERNEKRAKIIAERKKLREKLNDLKKKARKTLDLAVMEKYKQVVEEYERLMGKKAKK